MKLSRREYLAALTLAATGTAPLRAADAAAKDEPGSPLVAGFIIRGAKNDWGLGRVCIEAASALDGQLPWLQTRLVPNAATSDIEADLLRLINVHGARVIWMNHSDYQGAMLRRTATLYPAVTFVLNYPPSQAPPNWPPNLKRYAICPDEVAYLCGMLAALVSKTGKLGFLLTPNGPEGYRHVNAYMLGARAVETGAEVLLMLSRQSTANDVAGNAIRLHNYGVDVIGCATDRPTVVARVCEALGIPFLGSFVDLRALAPKTCLACSRFEMRQVFTDLLAELHDKGELHNQRVGGLSDNWTGLSPIAASVPKEIQQQIGRCADELRKRERHVFHGEIRDNRGNILIPAGKTLTAHDSELWLIERYVQGVQTVE